MSEDMKRRRSAIQAFWILLGRFVAAVIFQFVLICSHVNVHWMSNTTHVSQKFHSVFGVFSTFCRLLRSGSKDEGHSSPSLLSKGFLITEQLFVTELGSIVKHLNCIYTFQNSIMLTSLKALKQPCRVSGHGPEGWGTGSTVPGEPRCLAMECWRISDDQRCNLAL